MTANRSSSQSKAQFAGVSDMLACPACHSALRSEPIALVCSQCARKYPVIDGIPVLIANHSESHAT